VLHLRATTTKIFESDIPAKLNGYKNLARKPNIFHFSLSRKIVASIKSAFVFRARVKNKSENRIKYIHD
jgi:hypothetical protein